MTRALDVLAAGAASPLLAAHIDEYAFVWSSQAGQVSDGLHALETAAYFAQETGAGDVAVTGSDHSRRGGEPDLRA